MDQSAQSSVLHSFYPFTASSCATRTMQLASRFLECFPRGRSKGHQTSRAIKGSVKESL